MFENMIRASKEFEEALVRLAERESESAAEATPPAPLQCPQCGSTKLSGLMAAFWVSLTPEETLDGQWSDYEGCTEIGEERLCSDCGHEF